MNPISLHDGRSSSGGLLLFVGHNERASSAPATAAHTVATDERALVNRARRDPAAFAQLYRQYLTPIYSYALARVGNCDEAQDITSQTFLAAFEGIDRYRGESKFSTWLFGIARNKCGDYFRHRRGAAAALDLETAENASGPDPQVEEMAERSARFEELNRMIRRLPPDQAEALSLRIFGGQSAAETGKIMHKSEPAVKMLVHRAVEQLHARLGHWTEAER